MRVAAEMAEAEGEIVDGGHQPFNAWVTGLERLGHRTGWLNRLACPGRWRPPPGSRRRLPLILTLNSWVGVFTGTVFHRGRYPSGGAR